MTVDEAWAAADLVEIGGLGESDVELAIRIRLVEEKFLELFAAGKMNGTVHTCVG